MLKIAELAFFTITRPIAEVLVHHASYHPRLNTLYRIVGQKMYQLEHTAFNRIRCMEPIEPLTEEQAVHRGSEVMSEMIMFSIASAMIVASSSSKSRWKDLDRRVGDLEDRMDKRTNS